MRNPFPLLMLLPLLLYSCADRPGQTFVLEGAGSFSLNGETVAGVKMIPGQTLVTSPDRTGLFLIGNPNPQAIELSITGATPAKTILQPGVWTPLKLKTTAGKQVLSWAGEALYLAEPYFLPGNGKDSPKVLLISVDTLRYDFFTARDMPGLYRIFSESGQIFERIHTPTPWTLPAHASLLTSLYPASHGVRNHGDKLSETPTTLAGLLREKGYYNIAVTEGNYVSATFGLARGFHRFSENPPAMMETSPASASRLEGTIGQLLERIDQAGGAPTFAFLHTYEVHCPFLPRNGVEDPEGYGATQWLLDNDGKVTDPAINEKIRALYREEVAYTDQQLSPLVQRLLNEGWLVVLTSDHGDEFGEHGGLLHADNLYEEATHVPLAIAGHGKSGVLSVDGSLVDVPATILALSGLETPQSWQGRDLTNPNIEPHPVFAESFFFGVHIKTEEPRVLGVWKGNRKLIQTTNFGQIRAELYDLEGDPFEFHNLAEEQVEERDALFLRIQAYLETNGLASDSIDELTPAQLETMRSLGYIR